MDKHVMATDADGARVPDQVVIEEPLQIVIDGHPVAVTMRTPGHDAELALGFLLSEGVIHSRNDVRRIDTDSRDNHALVFLTEDAEVDLKKLTRHVFSASSCGVCGKATIETVTSQRPPLPNGIEISREVLLAAPAKLEAAPLSQSFLLVSGRVSFEIMQKALAGGLPLVAALSAPSSLAVDFAEKSNQTLVAFLRPPRFRVFAGRVTG